MPEPRVSLEDIIRSAAADLPPRKRTIVLTELLVELDSARGLELLSQARSAISLRMQELINERIGFEAHTAETRVFFDVVNAKIAWKMQQKRREARNAPDIPKTTWRDIQRVCLPGWLLVKGIGAITSPLKSVGPDACQRLERFVERHDDTEARGRVAVWRLSLARWLIQSPNDARQAIREETPASESSPSTDGLSQASDQGFSQSGQRAGK